ncbi:MAG: peptidase associated/transthyretin-like domain-containing protein [Ferrimicrobium sp.]|uniref:Protocatechuate 3,4-dioxygenase subunit alpha n=1 Tax=Ferrimicrobium acidiphilum TaxID=121039 RepID=A0ABV3XZP9_9ACTN|nr:hypothetical protein [Ferrimicrobium sp.]MCL5973952.1 protocatechuate 3,4-dioxygenase subunit alpha [Actinomycetota bacterium]
MMLPTPSQTVGPFFSFGLAWMVPQEPVDTGFVVEGVVVDKNADPVGDALVEALWVANGQAAFARSLCEPTGRYHLRITASGNEVASPILVSVFARGLLQRLVTAMYLTDIGDELLCSLDPLRRQTLIAKPTPTGYAFDVILSGESETVFLAW